MTRPRVVEVHYVASPNAGCRVPSIFVTHAATGEVATFPANLGCEVGCFEPTVQHLRDELATVFGVPAAEQRWELRAMASFRDCHAGAQPPIAAVVEPNRHSLRTLAAVGLSARCANVVLTRVTPPRFTASSPAGGSAGNERLLATSAADFRNGWSPASTSGERLLGVAPALEALRRDFSPDPAPPGSRRPMSVVVDLNTPTPKTKHKQIARGGPLLPSREQPEFFQTERDPPINAETALPPTCCCLAPSPPRKRRDRDATVHDRELPSSPRKTHRRPQMEDVTSGSSHAPRSKPRESANAPMVTRGRVLPPSPARRTSSDDEEEQDDGLKARVVKNRVAMIEAMFLTYQARRRH
jgi:hypothetical protein